MKTTLEISDALLIQAKEIARKEQTTLRALTEEGLARVLDERSSSPVEVNPVTFNGQGLTEDFLEADWSTFRDAAYGLHPK